MGNPSDMYGGSVVSCSIRERAYVSVEPSDRLLLESDQGVVEVRSRADLLLRGDHADILRAVVAHAYTADLKCHLKCWSEIPFGAGLSGSTAMVVAALAALHHFLGLKPNRYHFAELARSIELHHLKVVCGYQDQYMATFGGLNYMDFRDKEFYREVFSEPYASVESLLPYTDGPPPVILAHTGVKHNSGAVHKPIRERWLEGERAVIEAYIRVARLARLIGDDVAFLIHETGFPPVPPDDVSHIIPGVALREIAQLAKRKFRRFTVCDRAELPGVS